MKKLAFFILLIVLSAIEVNGQTGRPCAEYNQNRDISGMKEILMRDGVFYQNLRVSYAEAINYSVGKNIITSSKYGMEDILEKTILLDVNFVVPSDYLNGVRFGDNINFTTLTGQPSDKWAAFRFQGVDYIYAKVSCMNPQKPKKPGIFIEEKDEPIVDIINQQNWSFQEPKREIQPDIYLPPLKEEKKIKIGWIVIPVGAIILGTTAYLLSQQDHSDNGNYPGGTPPTRHDPSPNPPIDTGGPGGAPPSP